jgi:hypothetical protein
VLEVPGRLIISEWKFYRLSFLTIRDETGKELSLFGKAENLCNYTLQQVLDLEFGDWDDYHRGTIKDFVEQNVASQLRDYISSKEVTQMAKEKELELQAHLVIIVGSRQILLWDMDKDGKLAEPRLVGDCYSREVFLRP